MVYSTKKQFNSEQEFKTWFIKDMASKNTGIKVMPIETEETVPGFPDVLVFGNDKSAKLYEIKYADADGIIVFRKTQVQFFLLVQGIASVDIVAYDKMMNAYHVFPASALFDQTSSYYMNKLEVRLPR